ncbi:exodeoxyribonuclease VII large subunit [Sporolactobacillus vineae]|uniref:exodeoxyribonuclease VII large subunit n=1 Tax=Sporolactobacillus vineae TaxID=444463 RepID=UPI000287EAC7|nr:exodeoxyribonuclease VII large subunit [Sporolactobacillus vineae]
MLQDDRYVSVTRLTRYIKQKMESDELLREVWLKGEISNFKRHSRGHLYLTLKDNNARIRAVMFAGNARSLTFEPEDGMKVLVRGSISLYEPYGEYQIYIRQMEQDGLGRLYLAYEALKKKLETQGMFDTARKKPIPAAAREIAIITSPTGAAIRDLFTTIKRRSPSARLSVFPVLVQGAGAAPSIASAIEQANRINTFDLLIVGRGGGSIEDLWAFNEEIVAKAIFQSHIPVISAVGHETDFTIADFVADKRAPTPTAAGEFAVPDVRDLSRQLNSDVARLIQAMKNGYMRGRDRLKRARDAYAFRYPGQLILQKEQEYDRLADRLEKGMAGQLNGRREQLNLNDRLLGKNRPDAMISRAEASLKDWTARLARSAQNDLQTRSARFRQIVLQLNALSPLKIMARGYNLAYNQKHELVKSVRQLAPGDPLMIRMHDGKIDCQIWGIEEAKKK